MSRHHNPRPVPAHPAKARRLPKAIVRFLRGRHPAVDLDGVHDHLLRDIGLTRMDAEYTKPSRLF